MPHGSPLRFTDTPALAGRPREWIPNVWRYMTECYDRIFDYPWANVASLAVIAANEIVIGSPRRSVRNVNRVLGLTVTICLGIEQMGQKIARFRKSDITSRFIITH